MNGSKYDDPSSRGGRPSFRKTRHNRRIPRRIKGGWRRQEGTCYRFCSFALSLPLFEIQNFPSTKEPATGWAGWAQGERFHRSICQLVLLPHSCQITRPIPSWPSRFSYLLSRFFLPSLSCSMFRFLRDAGPFSSSLLLSFLLSVCLHYFHRAGLLFYVSTTPDSRFVFESTSCRRKKGEGEKER